MERASTRLAIWAELFSISRPATNDAMVRNGGCTRLK